MPLVLEGRDGELPAGIERRADAHRLARDLDANLLDRLHQAPQPTVGERRWILHVEVCAAVQRNAVGIAGHGLLRVGEADVARPLDGLVEVARVVEDLRAVGDPQEHGHLVGAADQRRPLGEQRAAHPSGRLLRVIGEGLEAHLERDVAEVHRYSLPPSMGSPPIAAFGRNQRGKLGLGTLENKANSVGFVCLFNNSTATRLARREQALRDRPQGRSIP